MAAPDDTRCDRGRTAVGAAEEHAFGGTAFDEPIGYDAVAELITSVTASPWWRQAGGPPVGVSPARRDAASSSARTDGHTVWLRFASGQCDRATVAHELAHVLAGIEAGHSARFRRAAADVTSWIAGADVASWLTDAFAAFDLDVADRPWPAPFRWHGPGFTIIP